MPRKSKFETIRCAFFRWRLYRRNAVWYADARSATRNLGRHSLGTKDHSEALQNLVQLDRAKAVELGLAKPMAPTETDRLLNLHAGRKLYESHLGRPEVAGGVSPKTKQRYHAVFDKFITFATGRGIVCWNSVTKDLVVAYLADLKRRGYGDRTLYLEATTIKQVAKYLVDEQHIAAACLLRIKLKKPTGSSTYCWRREEVATMIAHCESDLNLKWVSDVIRALCQTGLRSGELAALRWSDLDFERRVVRITNDVGPRGHTRAKRRRTKNRRDRALPMKAELRQVLQRQPRVSDGYVFHGPRGGRLKPDTLRNILVVKVIEPLKRRFPTRDGEVGFEHGRLHSFRHFFCSTAANAGVPQNVLMEWLGHQDSEMVRLYYHLHDDEAQRQMKRVDFTGEADGSGAVETPPETLEVPPTGRSICAVS